MFSTEKSKTILSNLFTVNNFFFRIQLRKSHFTYCESKWLWPIPNLVYLVMVLIMISIANLLFDKRRNTVAQPYSVLFPSTFFRILWHTLLHHYFSMYDLIYKDRACLDLGWPRFCLKINKQFWINNKINEDISINSEICSTFWHEIRKFYKDKGLIYNKLWKLKYFSHAFINMTNVDKDNIPLGKRLLFFCLV